MPADKGRNIVRVAVSSPAGGSEAIVSTRLVEVKIPAARGDVCDFCFLEYVAGAYVAGHINLVANIIPKQMIVAGHFVRLVLVVNQRVIALRTLQTAAKVVVRCRRGLIGYRRTLLNRGKRRIRRRG